MIALDLDTGRPVWTFQAMAADVWNMACGANKADVGPKLPVERRGRSGRRPRLRFRRRRDPREGRGRQGRDPRRTEIRRHLGARCRRPARSCGTCGSARAPRSAACTGASRPTASGCSRPINDSAVISAGARHAASRHLCGRHQDRQAGLGLRRQAELRRRSREARSAGCAAKYGFSAAPLTVDGAVVGGNARRRSRDSRRQDRRGVEDARHHRPDKPRSTASTARAARSTAHAHFRRRRHDLHQLRVRLASARRGATC